MFNFYLHADDIGASKSISNNILECSSILNSVSTIVTGEYFPELNKCTRLNENFKFISCHLNILEGKPITDPDKIPLLVDKNGYFNNSFINLILKYLLSSKTYRFNLVKQISLEFSNQISHYIKICSPREIRIDSHQHIHAIPFIFNLIIKLNFPIKYVRLPYEKFTFDIEIIRKFPENYIKWVILNTLSQICKRRYLLNSNIKCNDFLIGVLGSGCMNIRLLSKFLSRFKKSSGENLNIELLFHPGGAVQSEAYLWRNVTRFFDFYISRGRIIEKEMLTLHGKTILCIIDNLNNKDSMSKL